jgi:O-antigen/teichoic acid export membrane protein
MISMVKYLPADDVGVYGLFTAAISIALYFLGMDFYTYTSRQMFSRQKEEWALLVRDQFVLHIILYAIILPLFLSLFLLGLLPWRYIIYFYLILILEHLGQELYRLLINISRPTQANIVLFFRGGAWVYAVIALSLLGIKGLGYVWTGWLIGLCGSLALSVYFLKDMDWRRCLQHQIDWLWIRKGVWVSLPFFIGTIFLRLVEYMDRFVLEYFHGSSQVGIYTFFYSMANVVQVFVHTGVISILYPKIIESFTNGKYLEYRSYMRKMTVQSIGGVAILSVCAFIGISILLLLLDKPEFNEHKNVFIIILISIGFNIISNIPHYSLFVRSKDSAILICTIITFIISISSNFLLVPKYGLYGTGFSMLISMISLFGMKCVALIFLQNKPMKEGQ